jgi:hypothetical protein
MALLGKHRGNPRAPDPLHRGENAQFVVDQHIVISRIEALYVLELAFLVNIDEYTIIDCPPPAKSICLPEGFALTYTGALRLWSGSMVCCRTDVRQRAGKNRFLIWQSG